MRALLLALFSASVVLPALGAETSESRGAVGQQASVQAAGAAWPGVQRPDLAWQHWVLNCQGCHRADGTGSQATAPSLAGSVARFVTVAGGREYLGRVPGVATAALSDADLADLLNWTLWRFDRSHLGPRFQPYTAAELSVLRRQPLRTEASRVRAVLVGKFPGRP